MVPDRLFLKNGCGAPFDVKVDDVVAVHEEQALRNVQGDVLSPASTPYNSHKELQAVMIFSLDHSAIQRSWSRLQSSCMKPHVAAQNPPSCTDRCVLERSARCG